MNITVVSEHRLLATPGGRIWGDSGYAFWARYLDAFESVRLVCRVRTAPVPTKGLVPIDGPGIRVLGVPYYLGPVDYLRNRRAVTDVVQRAFVPGDAVILRLGSQLAGIMARRLWRARAPYGVEVVGDPRDVFTRGVVDHPLRPLFRWWFSRQQKRLCEAACGAAYVTARTLQQRYPCGRYAVGVADVAIDSDVPTENGVMVTHYSSVQLASRDFVERARTSDRLGPLRLITVGSMAQLYKGIDVVIRAVSQARSAGLEVTLTVVGEGKYKPGLQALAAGLGIADRVRFVGALPGPRAVQDELDVADLFVLASRTEGLPRALIEAMARGLPCVATRVGGIPELLPDRWLVAPGSVQELAAKISEVHSSREVCAEMSRVNLANALQYREEVLRTRRLEFYRHVRAVTEAWASSHVVN